MTGAKDGDRKSSGQGYGLSTLLAMYVQRPIPSPEDAHIKNEPNPTSPLVICTKDEPHEPRRIAQRSA
jgi:hypothetical protein